MSDSVCRGLRHLVGAQRRNPGLRSVDTGRRHQFVHKHRVRPDLGDDRTIQGGRGRPPAGHRIRLTGGALHRAGHRSGEPPGNGVGLLQLRHQRTMGFPLHHLADCLGRLQDSLRARGGAPEQWRSGRLRRGPHTPGKGPDAAGNRVESFLRTPAGWKDRHPPGIPRCVVRGLCSHRHHRGLGGL